MNEPTGEGWVGWAETKGGGLINPFPDLRENERIVNHYDYDADRLIRAWSRVVPTHAAGVRCVPENATYRLE